MILFKPVNRTPEVFDFSGALMSQALTSNPYALNSPKVFIIFVGPNWYKNGEPTPFVSRITSTAEAILNSPYLKGLRQYGSDGIANYVDFYVDTTLDPLTWSMDYVFPDGHKENSNNPVWFETNRIISSPPSSSWLPPGGDARNSPIYVVVRYTRDGSSPPAIYSGSGSNSFGPREPYTSLAINVIDVALTTADQVDGFSWAFSHEIVERMSTGTGDQGSTGVYEIAPDRSGQIADGEPEGAGFYAWRLNGSDGPLVTSYWSVVDQEFIVPDDNQRALLDPIWNGNEFAGLVSLQEASLYMYQSSALGLRTLIDTQVLSYATSSHGGVTRIFDLTADNRVKEYSESGSNWTPVTAPNIIASTLVATTDGRLYMQASTHFGPHFSGPTVWQYSGSGTNWAAVTGGNTKVVQTAAVGDTIFMLASNGGENQVWRYDGSGTNWTVVTGTNTKVVQIAAAGNAIFMLASNGGENQVWRYDGSGTNWTAVTGTNTKWYKSQGLTTSCSWWPATMAEPMWSGNTTGWAPAGRN